MGDEQDETRREAAERVVKLEEELEASGVPVLAQDALAEAKAVLHQWVEGIVATVVSPGLGRVTVIHADGRQSSIVSPDLPFLMSKPVKAQP
jgi:hypothetical protein